MRKVIIHLGKICEIFEAALPIQRISLENDCCQQFIHILNFYLRQHPIWSVMVLKDRLVPPVGYLATRPVRYPPGSENRELQLLLVAVFQTAKNNLISIDQAFLKDHGPLPCICTG